MHIRYTLQFGFQVLVILWNKILMQPFTRRDFSQIPPGAIMRRSYMLIGNHRRAFDPFVICAILPWRTILSVLPIGFVTHNVFYDSPLRPLLWIMGCFPAKNPKGKHKIFGIDGAVTLLNNGFSIFIFPEGTRIKGKPRGEAKWGVIKIHQATPGTPFILAHIEYNKGIGAWLTFNRRVVRYKLVENPKFDNPESIMDDVFAL